MSKFHDDTFLWGTINNVIPAGFEEVNEKVYSKLYGTVWKVSDIEELAKELIRW